ncbi:hypothetical protein B0T19DRAFT_433500 [Cercophora scortea]|uniref:Uncharacterized protein n=1 Tax=Cercophora scortea TaxID=314031 RepID=A0AAE0I947_9PEZI|nr:hypothetical protein B0T19DRAFT_433500 [Cercophora scortea]
MFLSSILGRVLFFALFSHMFLRHSLSFFSLTFGRLSRVSFFACFIFCNLVCVENHGGVHPLMTDQPGVPELPTLEMILPSRQSGARPPPSWPALPHSHTIICRPFMITLFSFFLHSEYSRNTCSHSAVPGVFRDQVRDAFPLGLFSFSA